MSNSSRTEKVTDARGKEPQSHVQPTSVYLDVRLEDPSNSIRLLKFTHTKIPEITVRLSSVPLDERPTYCALSYSWFKPLGKPNEDEFPEKASPIIWCNDQPLSVTRNLYGALIAIKNEPELSCSNFWVDAICIDQHGEVNPREKGPQVRLMSKIFGGAERVVAWLGPADTDTPLARDLLETLYETRDAAWRIVPTNLDHPWVGRLIGERNQSLLSWQALARFFTRSYFSRAWIIQEVLFAREMTVLCGDWMPKWKAIETVSSLLSTGPWGARFRQPGFAYEGGRRPHHGGPAKLRANKDPKSSRSLDTHTKLLYSLIRSREYDCADPKDKIYSLLGFSNVASQVSKSSFEIDYTLPTEIVYTRTAIAILDNSDDFLLLAYAEGDDYRRIKNMPSWIPDWSCTDVIGLGITGYRRFAASGNWPREMTIHERQSSAPMLQLTALELDHVSDIGETKQEVQHGAQFLNWLRIVSSLGATYRTGESTFDVFWRTLIADTAPSKTGTHGPRSPAPPDMRQSFKTWLAIMAAPHMTTANGAAATLFRNELERLGRVGLDATFSMATSTIRSLEDDSEHSEADWFDGATHHALCLRLFRTKNGMLGLGTTSVRVGDSIWVVPGSRIPLIFRPLENASSTQVLVELVGGCYIHGFMHGQAILSPMAKFREILVR